MKLLLLTLILGFFPLTGVAFDDTPPCYKKLAVNFFEPSIVKQSFDLFTVYQSQWDYIYSNIQEKKGEVLPRVKKKAKGLKKNPFEHPFDGKKAVELLLDVELEIFKEALHERRFTDQNAILGMFKFIQGKKQSELDECAAYKSPYLKK